MTTEATAAAERLAGNWWDAYGCTEEGLSRACLDDIEAVRQAVAERIHAEDAEWVAASRVPEKPGWYWAWDGYPGHESVVVKISRDELGNWSWACGQWFGQLASMSGQFPWRWSAPIRRAAS